MIEKIPKKPGVYLLLVNVMRNIDIKTRIKLFRIPRGYYVYIGSARSKYGLYNRVKRYLYPSSRRFWHIDYLISSCFVELVGIIYREIDNRDFDWETYLARTLRSKMQFINEFGCSDKKWNTSHLYKCGDSVDECLEKLLFLKNELFEYVLLNHLVYKPL